MTTFFEDTVRNFPLMRGGGIFILIVGIGLVVGGAIGRRGMLPALIAGGILAILSQVVLNRRLLEGLARPSIVQWAVLGIAVVVEIGLVNLVVYRIPNRESRDFWLWMLIVVGAHFLILGLSHGPLSALLGALCILSAGLGLVLPGIEYRWFWLFDGVLKLAFGVLMIWLTYRFAAPRPT